MGGGMGMMGMGGGMMGMGGGGGAGVSGGKRPEARPGDWDCPRCYNLNFSSRSVRGDARQCFLFTVLFKLRRRVYPWIQCLRSLTFLSGGTLPD
jgi:hypothetical protein